MLGYDNEFIPTSVKRAPDQTVELTNEVIDYLKGIFNMFDIDNIRRHCEAQLLSALKPHCAIRMTWIYNL